MTAECNVYASTMKKMIVIVAEIYAPLSHGYFIFNLDAILKQVQMSKQRSSSFSTRIKTQHDHSEYLLTTIEVI